MADDDQKQRGFEILDETRPERNRRSFFDWLTGKEDSEEERLRKKLDEELKEAARKRAEQFEEEEREREERDVAETKKLKKRWRKKLVEKSQKRLEEAEDRPESELNGYEVAQLMVAERIVKLHEMLTDEALDLRRSEIKALKIHIDFMGLLSEKLDRPELDVPEEVEKLYHTIANSIEETTGEQPPEADEVQATDSEIEAPPLSTEDLSYLIFAKRIVNAIRRTVEPSRASEGFGTGTTARSSVTPNALDGVPKQELLSSPDGAEATAAVIPLIALVRKTAQSAESVKREVFHAETIQKMGEIVQKADLTAETIYTTPANRPNSAMTPKPPLELEQHKSSVEQKRVLRTAPKPETKTPTRTYEAAYRFPDVSAEYWSEADLVRKAEEIDIGNGYRLASAYRNGEIDRAGLIKVIKSHKKGKNYVGEYREQRKKWLLNQERLKQPSKIQANTVDQDEDIEASKPEIRNIGQSSRRQEHQELSNEHDTISRQDIQNRAKELKKTAKKQAQMLLFVSSAILVILLILLMVLLDIL